MNKSIVKLVSEYSQISNKILKVFLTKIFPETDTTFYWVSNKTDIVSINEEYFFSVPQMIEILEWDYSSEIVLQYHNYISWYSGINNKYWISLKNFSELYLPWTKLSSFSRKYHSSVLKNNKYWKSNEGIEKTKEMTDKLTQEFLKNVNK